MNAAESGPPKPALARLAMRAMPKSVALIHRRTPQRSHSQCAEPMWSGCMWVTMTRSTGRPPRSLAKISSHEACVASLPMPQSTMLQPWRGASPPLPAISSRSSQTLMWLSANGSCMRAHLHARRDLDRPAGRGDLLAEAVVELGFERIHRRATFRTAGPLHFPHFT